MKFRTEIKIADAPENLSPERLVLLMGSCFSDNIGARMEQAGWPVEANPCGTVYNPVSIAVLMRLAMIHRPMRREIVASSLTDREGKYVSWFMGSKAGGATEEECVDAVCECIDRLEDAIERAQAIVVTFGTADVWLLAGTDRAIGNCHKHPASEFDKKRASVEEIAALWKETVEAVRMRNPEMKIIFTVSPRRYLGEGTAATFADNSRMKAVLLLACEALCQEIKNAWYFPAYELLNDDLRDYRFYASDMLHPSAQAVEYIWEKYCEMFLDQEGREKLKELEKEERRKRHIQK